MGTTKEGRYYLNYSFYKKPIATNKLILASSAIPCKVKITTNVCHVTRRLFNTSLTVPWVDKCKILDRFMLDMYHSGYNEKDRLKVIQESLVRFQKILDTQAQGGRPLHRDRKYKEMERYWDKKIKKKCWFKDKGNESPLFVPFTPGSELAIELKTALANQEIKIKIVERAGKTIKSQLQSSNPFKNDNCTRKDCVTCADPECPRGVCTKSGVVYQIQCMECAAKDINRVYRGETGHTVYTRFLCHQHLFENQSENSTLWRHSEDDHESDPDLQYSYTILKELGSDALLRQISEGVLIDKVPPSELLNSRREWRTPIVVNVRIGQNIGNSE
jgi:hypothetical protein